jgi:hypothetical protein
MIYQFSSVNLDIVLCSVHRYYFFLVTLKFCYYNMTLCVSSNAFCYKVWVLAVPMLVLEPNLRGQWAHP